MKALRVADITLFTGCMLGSALLSYLVYRHGWSDYYWALVATCVIFLACLRLQPSARINVALIVLSTAMASYAAEIIMAQASTTVLASNWSRWMAWSHDELDSRSERERRRHAEYDSRNRLEVIQDLRRKGVEAYPPIGANLLLGTDASHSLVSSLRIDGIQVLPFGGISNRTTVYCNESGQFTIYDSDEHGFHNPFGIWRNSLLDIAIIGDSFTQGACVPTNKNFVALIRHQYPATVNLGMAANGPLIELATLSEYLIEKKPKVVFWVYYEGNDLQDLSSEKDSSILMSYLAGAAGQSLLGRQAAVDKALTDYVLEVMKHIERESSLGDRRPVVERVVTLSHLREQLALLKFSDLSGETKKTKVPVRASQETVDLFRRILEKANQTAQAWGGKMVFVYLPHWARYSGSATPNQDRDHVLEMVHSLGIPVIDMHPAFAAQKDPLALFPFRLHGHYNEEGNRVVAEEMLKFIKGSSWVGRGSEYAVNNLSSRPEKAGGIP